MYKISEQQVNPKVLSVAKSCHYNEDFKKSQTSFIDKCPPLGSCPTNPRPRGNSLDAKAPGRGQVFGADPRGCAGGWLWMKLIPALLNW